MLPPLFKFYTPVSSQADQLWIHLPSSTHSGVQCANHAAMNRLSSTSWHKLHHDDVIALLAICAGNSPVTGEFPAKGQWRGVLMFSLICVWINGWVSNREASDLRRHRAHYDITGMPWTTCQTLFGTSWMVWHSKHQEMEHSFDSMTSESLNLFSRITTALERTFWFIGCSMVEKQ